MTNSESLPSTPCPVCHGIGTITHGSGAGRMYQLDCEACSGTGPIPATNTGEACPTCGDARGLCVVFCTHPTATNTSESVKPFLCCKDGCHTWGANGEEICRCSATPALQDEPERTESPDVDGFHSRRTVTMGSARPSAKRIEPLRELFAPSADEQMMHNKLQELIAAHNESQGKRE